MKSNGRGQILIYEKQIKGPVGPVEPYADYLRSLGYQVHVIQYGNYTLEEYKKQLLQSFLMIGFVTDESQGIAWAEAWSCDVPTFLWNNHSNIYRGRIYSCTTAPYLTKENGIFFDNFSDFIFKLQQWDNNALSFEPRKILTTERSDLQPSTKTRHSPAPSTAEPDLDAGNRPSGSVSLLLFFPDPNLQPSTAPSSS
jgi:hypothetical protein